MVELNLSLVNTRGYILVVMMVFLSILSMLALGMLNLGLLESKMDGFSQDKIKSFYIAENYLLRARQQIVFGGEVTNATVEKIDADECGVTFYRLTSKGNYRGAESVLQSTIAKLHEGSACDEKLRLTAKGQSFVIIK
ncbi:MAG: hypothetical protein KKE11_01870 [Gammaproteobacteria bacterium]|nr:hypothetical protein [Gammaproteobacteria bacterium]